MRGTTKTTRQRQTLEAPKADESLFAPFREKLDSLRDDVKKYNPEELEALAGSEEDMARFLIARDNDIDKAFAMARASLVWRSKFRPSQLTVNDFPTAQSQKVWRFAGSTKDGCGILHVTAANWKSFAYGLDEYIKMVSYHVELCLANNPQSSKIVIIMDMKNMGYLADMRKLRSLVHILCDYYPERLSQCIFVNCDWVFDKLFNIAIRWVDPRTREKCVDFRDNGVEYLLNYIDADQLTKDLGGTREDEWPMQQPVSSSSSSVQKEKDLKQAMDDTSISLDSTMLKHELL